MQAPLADVPEDVEVGVRSDGARRIVVLINHDATPHNVRLPAPMRALLGPTPSNDTVQLAPDDVAVLEQRR